MLGAGSGFTPRLVNDLFLTPGNRGGEIALVDIDTARLQAMHMVVKKLMAKHGAKGWKVTASPDRRTVLKGSDYIVNCIEVSGLACVRHDNDIPARYGLDRCIGDTIGPGGLFKGLPHMAAVCTSNMPTISLAARAAVERSKELAIYALLLDPLTSAVLSPAEIKNNGTRNLRRGIRFPARISPPTARRPRVAPRPARRARKDPHRSCAITCSAPRRASSGICRSSSTAWARPKWAPSLSPVGRCTWPPSSSSARSGAWLSTSGAARADGPCPSWPSASSCSSPRPSSAATEIISADRLASTDRPAATKQFRRKTRPAGRRAWFTINHIYGQPPGKSVCRARGRR
jgi:hypothetical protein